MVSSSEYRSIEILLVFLDRWSPAGVQSREALQAFFLGWEQTVCGWKTCKCHCWHWKGPSWWTPQAYNVPFWNNQRAGDQFEEIIPCWVGTVIIFDITNDFYIMFLGNQPTLPTTTTRPWRTMPSLISCSNQFWIRWSAQWSAFWVTDHWSPSSSLRVWIYCKMTTRLNQDTHDLFQRKLRDRTLMKVTTHIMSRFVMYKYRQEHFKCKIIDNH